MKHTIRGQNGTECENIESDRFAPTLGQNGLIPFFLIFPISQDYIHICLHFVIEYMYCYGLNIPAKYHDNRLDIFNVGSIFP